MQRQQARNSFPGPKSSWDFRTTGPRSMESEKSELLDQLILSWLPQVRIWLGKQKIIQGQGKVGEFHFKSGKIFFNLIPMRG